MQIHFYIPVIQPFVVVLYLFFCIPFTALFFLINCVEERHWYGFQILLLGLFWPITLLWHILRFLRWFLFNRI